MRHFIRLGSTALVLVAILVPSQALHAQRQGRWSVAARLGLVAWDKAAGIQDPILASSDCDYPALNQTCASTGNSLMGGISALYYIANSIGIGLAFDVSRPITNGAYFPAAEMEFQGAQDLTLVNQRLTILQYQVAGEWSLDRKLSPVVTGGVGGYTVYPDPPKEDAAATTGFQNFSDVMFSVGLGLDWAVSAAGGLRLSVTDMIYTGWERSALNPVAPAYQTNVWPDLLPEPPAESSTLHNINLALAFTFTPGGNR